MNIQVTPHTIVITLDSSVNAGEYNITPCEFTFTEEYENLAKTAIFSSSDGTVIKTPILNNQCAIPIEVLQHSGNVSLGVYAYETDNDELVLRYSPTPKYFNVRKGSFKVGNDPDLPSPTEWERVLEQINQAIEETNNLNITANKEGKVTTITITKKDGTTQEVEINDGKDLEFKWEGTSLGIRQEGQSQYQYTNLQGPKGEAGAIHMIIVQTLPTHDIDESAIYLVPLENPTEEGNNYAEYVYINNQWELLGKIGVQVDLTDYVKNTDYATNAKGGVLKTGNGTYLDGNGIIVPSEYSMSSYNDRGRNTFISKGTLENVITGKGLVSNTDYASSTTGGVIKGTGDYSFSVDNQGRPNANVLSYSNYLAYSTNNFISKGTLENVIVGKDLTTKAYVDGLVGDIESILEELDIGGGVQ